MRPESDAMRQLSVLAIVLLALALLAGLAWQPLSRLGPGVDEVAHAGAAYMLLRTGSNEMNVEHPRLAKRLMGVGLQLRYSQERADLPLQPRADQWQFGQRLLFGNPGQTAQVLNALRLPMLLLAILGALGVLIWAWQLFGRNGGLLALIFYCLSPTVHAHAALAIMDLAVGVFALWAALFAWYAWQHRTVWAAFAAGALCAAAALTKFSGLIVPTALCLALICAAWRQRERGNAVAPLGWHRTLPGLLGVTLLGFVVAAPLLNGGAWHLDEYLLGIGKLRHNHPADYYFYLFGHFSPTGFVSYFPATLLLKSTPGELIAFVLAGYWLLRSVRSAERDPQSTATYRNGAGFFLLLPPALYLLLFMALVPNFGHRYVVPLYPFLFVLAGCLTLRPTRSIKLALLVALVLQGQAAVVATPDPLSYANGILGCRGARTIQCLDESNIDWGQEIRLVWPKVAPLLAADEPVYIDYYGAAILDAYLPRYRQIDERGWIDPPAGLYVISVHAFLRRSQLLDPKRPHALRDGADFDSRIGNSYLLIDTRIKP